MWGSKWVQQVGLRRLEHQLASTSLGDQSAKKNPWAGQQHSSFTKNQTHFSTVSGAGMSAA